MYIFRFKHLMSIVNGKKNDKNKVLERERCEGKLMRDNGDVDFCNLGGIFEVTSSFHITHAIHVLTWT